MTTLLHKTAVFFRQNSVTIPLIVIAVCILAIFLLQAVTIGKLSDQVKSQNQLLTQTKQIAESIVDSSNDRTKQIDDLNKHMDCIVKFFAQSDRETKAIDDIQACRIKSDDTSLSANATPLQPTRDDKSSQTAKPQSNTQKSQTSTGSGAPAPPPESESTLQKIIDIPLNILRKIPLIGGNL